MRMGELAAAGPEAELLPPNPGGSDSRALSGARRGRGSVAFAPNGLPGPRTSDRETPGAGPPCAWERAEPHPWPVRSGRQRQVPSLPVCDPNPRGDVKSLC